LHKKFTAKVAEDAEKNSNWPRKDAKGTKIYCLGVGNEEVYNIGISKITIPQKSVLVDDVFQVLVEVTNNGERSSIVNVTLETPSETKNQEEQITKNSIFEFRFNVSATTPGEFNMRVTIPQNPQDILAIDNEINFSVHVKDKLYFVEKERIYMYIRDGIEKVFGPYAFVKPVNADREGFQFSTRVEKELVGQVALVDDRYSEDESVVSGDVVTFSKDSEYEFVINDEKFYRVPTRNIVAVL